MTSTPSGTYVSAVVSVSGISSPADMSLSLVSAPPGITSSAKLQAVNSKPNKHIIINSFFMLLMCLIMSPAKDNRHRAEAWRQQHPRPLHRSAVIDTPKSIRRKSLTNPRLSRPRAFPSTRRRCRRLRSPGLPWCWCAEPPLRLRPTGSSHGTGQAAI